YNFATLVTFGNARAGWHVIARYKKKYASRSVDYIVPLLALLFIGILFVLFARSQGGIAFLFLAAASGLMIYWIREIRMMARSEEQKLALSRDSDQKDWVYDLIKNNDDEMIFVAEIPGPEDQINVRLSDGLLRIKGGQNFSRDVPLDQAHDMGISDYKYRNGVLTVKIQKT
ncbi:MAG TPA: Hsp20/alpha crystallin family protein, partial [Nitrososphaera sp.]|nr:Hsp20/alpha crystallin family protein [Nitrososphaera sp.]